MSLLVVDYEPQEPLHDNDNASQLDKLTKEVVAIQYHAMGHSSLHIESQVNMFARDSLGLLRTLGAKQQQLHELIDALYADDPNRLETAIEHLGVSTVSLFSTLCIDLHDSTRKGLESIIRNPHEFAAITVDVAHG